MPAKNMVEYVRTPDGKEATLKSLAYWLAIHGAREGDLLDVSDSALEDFARDFDKRLAAIRSGGENDIELRAKMERCFIDAADELLSVEVKPREKVN